MPSHALYNNSPKISSHFPSHRSAPKILLGPNQNGGRLRTFYLDSITGAPAPFACVKYTRNTILSLSATWGIPGSPTPFTASRRKLLFSLPRGNHYKQRGENGVLIHGSSSSFKKISPVLPPRRSRPSHTTEIYSISLPPLFSPPF